MQSTKIKEICENPSISVVITAYNRENFLEYAMNSILEQNVRPLEVILITNFEYDLTRYKELNVTHLIRNGNVGEFLSEGIETARGDIIVFLDDDDILMPNKIQTARDVFRDENVVYFHNGCQFIDSSGKPIRKIRFKTIDFNLSSISIRKRIIDINKLKQVKAMTDVTMYLFALSSGGKIVNNKKPLTLYRIHKQNTGSMTTANLDHLHLSITQISEFQLIFNNCHPCKKILKRKIIDAEMVYLAADTKSYSINRLVKIFLVSLPLLNFRALLLMVYGFINKYIRCE